MSNKIIQITEKNLQKAVEANDPTNYLHQLCEDCIIALPPDPNQRYPEQTYQTMTESISMGRDES